ncbi:DUF2970 domain-containing protein [Photobacterium sanctipauli]|uniref:DUF2970 domain-containing protein n=1 Tax=Photobacterium sanctipauli TaxID=1342794 RepID=A0A2T3NSK7_9GAMM|nr:DUF2970 domain-containing protein [Photobacterium sanctipauli]PSW19227.1 DUF2970 domain-containing protein [Photobacterium sanctipauli]
MGKQEAPKNDRQGTGIIQVLASVAAALFGVQSDKNRRHDFSQHTAWPFIIGGIVLIAAFVALLIGVSHLVAG